MTHDARRVVRPPGAGHPGRSAGRDMCREKAELRALITAERRARSEEQRLLVARGLRDVFLELPLLCGASCVALYASRGGEPGTQLLRTALAARGVRVLLPVITEVGVVRWRPDAIAGAVTVAGRRHGERDRPDPLPRDAEVVVVPALAVDTCGRRLGHGGDGYDEVLRRLGRGCPVLAAVHDSEVLDAAVEPVPEEPHDVRVGAVLTPSRVLRLTAGTARVRRRPPSPVMALGCARRPSVRLPV